MFELEINKGKTYILRKTFPRFKGIITFGKLSDIEEIQMIDNCTDPQLLAKVMREAGEFILSKNINN